MGCATLGDEEMAMLETVERGGASRGSASCRGVIGLAAVCLFGCEQEPAAPREDVPVPVPVAAPASAAVETEHAGRRKAPRLQLEEAEAARTAPHVGAFEAGNTPTGIADLAGNVWELTSTREDAARGAHVTTGGSFVFSAREARRCRGHGPLSRAGLAGVQGRRLSLRERSRGSMSARRDRAALDF